ncbi:MAG: hypothetical protein QW476_01330 [Candidatus Bathyarchaeia archaeon]
MGELWDFKDFPKLWENEEERLYNIEDDFAVNSLETNWLDGNFI